MDNQVRLRFAQAAFDNGQVARRGNHHAEAAHHFRMAHALMPESPDILLNLGNACRDSGDPEGALSAWSDAVALAPWHHAALANLASALSEQERHADALATIERCLILAPDWFNAIANIEVILRGMGRHADSVRWAQRQIALWPDDHRGWMAVAASHHRMGDARQALAYQKKAVDLAPDDPHVQSAEAILHQELGFGRDADELFSVALRKSPNDAALQWNAALAALNLGDLPRGWDLYEARFAAGTAARRRHFLPDLPQWEGRPLKKSERLLVWREQGIGDEIMWAGCYPHLPAGSIVECSARLQTLFQRSFPHLDIRPELNGPLPPVTHQIACGSLPRLFRRRHAAFPVGAYLRAEARPRHPNLWAAISWRSMRSRAGQTARGYPRQEEWAALRAWQGDMPLISLQYDDDPPDSFPLLLARTSDIDLKNDFEAVAALIASRKAVVTVGNTVGALAGALGVPTAMLMLEGDYTMLGTNSYPWARSVTCFVKRASEPDWSRQMAEIAAWLKTV